VKSADLNGINLDFTREENPYRTGAARIPMASIASRFKDSGNRLTISMG
jgi:hypothetical protein